MMSEFEADHGQICIEFLRRSRQYLADGALLQASEKGWGAAAQAAKVYADARDYAYRSHSHFNHVVNLLAQETDNRMAREWAVSASALHENFYQDWMDAQMIAGRLDDVEKFIDSIAGLTDTVLTE